MTPHHMQERLQWAQGHVTKTINDWTPVFFTDESWFSLDFMDTRVRVWTMPNERLAQVCSSEHDRLGGGSVMV